MKYMQETQITIPPTIYKKLETEAKRHQVSISDFLQILIEGKRVWTKKTSAHFIHDILALAPQFRGPKDLSSTYEGILYGGSH